MTKTPGFKCVDCGNTEFDICQILGSSGRGCGGSTVSVYVCVNCGRIHTKKGDFEEDGVGLTDHDKPIYLKNKTVTTDRPKPKKITPELLKKIQEEIMLELGKRLKEVLKEKGVTEIKYSILTDGACPFCRAHHPKRK